MNGNTFRGSNSFIFAFFQGKQLFHFCLLSGEATLSFLPSFRGSNSFIFAFFQGKQFFHFCLLIGEATLSFLPSFRGSNSFIFAFFLNEYRCLTLLHSERPKLYTILAFLSAIGLGGKSLFLFSLLIPQFIRTSSVRVANRKSHELFPFIKWKKNWMYSMTLVIC